jgi:hypothetical protein
MIPLTFLKKTLITHLIQKIMSYHLFFCDLFYHLMYFVLD